jgi:hypothetical protein
MFLPKFLIVVSMSLPDHSTFVNTKYDDLAILYSEHLQTKNSNTIEYNYIKTKDYIESNHKKYQDFIW